MKTMFDKALIIFLVTANHLHCQKHIKIQKTSNNKLYLYDSFSENTLIENHGIGWESVIGQQITERVVLLITIILMNLAFN